MKAMAIAFGATAMTLLTTAAAEMRPEEVGAKLERSLPGFRVTAIKEAGHAGLLEVVSGSEIYYTDRQGNVLVQGNLIDTKTKANITQARLAQVNAIPFESLPLDSAVKIVRGTGERRIAIFEDPNCGPCKRLERELQRVDNVTVYVFLYPILSADSRAKSASVWCSADRAKTWLDAMVRDLPVPAAADCGAPLDRNLAFGQGKAIRGTPTMVFENGERTSGALAAAELERRLVAAAATKPASAASAATR